MAGRALWWICCIFGIFLTIPGGLSVASADDDTGDDLTDQGPAFYGVKLNPSRLAMRVSPLVGGYAREDAWSTLRVQIANMGPEASGNLILATNTFEGKEVIWRYPVELSEGARKDVLLYLRPGLSNAQQVVRFQAGARFAQDTFKLDILSESDGLIGVIGVDALGINGIRDAWTAPIPSPYPMAATQEPRQVRSDVIPMAGMPDRAEGYQALNWVVWNQPQPSRVLRAKQIEGLRGWVAQGGHLFVTVSDNWREVSNSPLADILPVELTGLEDAETVDPLLQALGVYTSRATPTPVATARLRDIPGRKSWTLTSLDDGRPLWVAGTYGLGTVHVLLLNPTVDPVRSAIPRKEFWRQVLFIPEGDQRSWNESHSLLPDELHHAMFLDGPTPGSVYEQRGQGYLGDTPWHASLKRYLQNIPGVAPLPMSWLLAFSLLYLFIIGPVDYFLLRLIRRQPLTWITFPVYIVVFSAVALVGTAWVKGSQAIMMRIEVIDVLPGTNLWRGDAYFGIFSTRKTNLTVVSGDETGLIQPLGDGGFMEARQIESSAGAGAMEYLAQTWTLAFGRSSWLNSGQGSITVRPNPDDVSGWVIKSTLPVTLEDAELWKDGQRFDVGEVPAGEEVVVDLVASYITDNNNFLDNLEGFDWALSNAEALEEGRGHLDMRGQWVLTGVTSQQWTTEEIRGLRPIPTSVTLFRVPVMIESDGSAGENP